MEFLSDKTLKDALIRCHDNPFYSTAVMFDNKRGADEFISAMYESVANSVRSTPAWIVNKENSSIEFLDGSTVDVVVIDRWFDFSKMKESEQKFNEILFCGDFSEDMVNAFKFLLKPYFVGDHTYHKEERATSNELSSFLGSFKVNK